MTFGCIMRGSRAGDSAGSGAMSGARSGRGKKYGSALVTLVTLGVALCLFSACSTAPQSSSGVETGDASQLDATNRAEDSASGGDSGSSALVDLFGTRLVDSDGQEVSVAEIEGRKIGIYFSASWCPPCQAFTPVLVETFNGIAERGGQFAVVLVSLDSTEDDMYRYMKQYGMPWNAVPFGASEAKQLLSGYDISGIPSLVIVDSGGETLSTQGRSDVSRHGIDAYDLW
jgi:cytochrome oxidase Cu insertion factor (SCO1/SenC/PrrC family)